MALRLAQSEEYAGNDYWKWAVWLEGSDEELDAIKHVEYVLHPTFLNPVREVSDRGSKFRLQTAGWGTFTLHATVIFKDGKRSPLALEHELVLLYPIGTPTSA